MTGELANDSDGAIENHDPDALLSESARARLARALPPNTKRAYERQGRAFTEWCAQNGRTALPATQQTLADYVSHLADLDKSPATIEQAISAIRMAHRVAGHKGLPHTDAALFILRVHRRDRAASGRRPRKAPPITLGPLRAMVEATDPSTPRGLRDRLILVLGFAIMARRSELSALHTDDISFTEDGLVIRIRMSKADQDATGAEVHVPPGVHPDTDPVRLTRAWLDLLDDQGIPAGPLLRRIDRQGRIGDGLKAASINDIVRALAVKAGLPNAENYTAHGLRAGGPTEAAKAGQPVAFIAEHGRWSKTSPQIMEYIRPVDKWQDNPMRGIGL
ncbi:site-specific integrase [Streptomyces lavendulocolor]|uniref:Site-specific integrase n=1 Tax=Streptomyces lavendulocolor TaxID=67316 RepID=A0ABV2WFU7_9ACTN